jgi:transposase
MGNRDRKGYQTDVTDEEWAFVAPYLALCREDATRRNYLLRAVFNAVRYVAKSGCPWRMLPKDLPPWKGRGADRWCALGNRHFVPSRRTRKCAGGFSSGDQARC